ncbi:MAG: sce7725 family protein [Bacteroidales bacterium]|nr:sce7725 family protein [Bacteroidales bacterium]
MYFPYLRGKQFELIALRETSDILAKYSKKISPIIEPVKNSSTLRTTLKELMEKDINFNLIINPTIGDLTKSTKDILLIVQEELRSYSNYQLAVIVEEKTDIISLVELINRYNLKFIGVTLIHNAIRPNISNLISSISKYYSTTYNVIYFQKTSRRYYREFDSNTLVGLEDFFISQTKNADYLTVQDSQFSEEHLYYSKDGYNGFSDFLTIGDNYSESGFLPFAVAIHISYTDTENKIRIKHFVSDSNDDNSDTGGKFIEALRKLIKWSDNNRIETKAMNIFRELDQSGHFPGLGSIKKLSIMHHIELVLKLI